jgi:TPR repeat protein
MSRLAIFVLALTLLPRVFGGAKESEWAEVISLRKSKAASGDANSQFVMGMNHRSGIPGLVNQDDVMAANYFKSAAEAGDQFGQMELSACFLEGAGVPKSDSEAYKWLLLSAGQGNKIAKEKMLKVEAALTPKQREDGQSRAEAFTKQFTERPATNSFLRQQSANKELAIAMECMKQEVIMATKRQAIEALPHLKIAANQGHPVAQHRLSFVLSMIDGLQDLPESTKWLIRAAHQGQQDAQYDLAWAYTNEFSGFKRDPFMAQKWFKVLSISNASDRVMKPLRAQIEKISSPDERAQGDELGSSFRPDYEF